MTRNTENGGWRTVHRHCSRSVLRSEPIKRLWDDIVEMGLKPVFIGGFGGEPLFGVELPSFGSK